MRALLLIFSLIAGIGMVFQKRYRILNALMSVKAARKFLVSTSMKVPYLRKKMLPAIFGRSAS